jgi:hypothetical protein
MEFLNYLTDMKRHFKLGLIGLLASIALFSCSKDDNPVIVQPEKRVIVINQGNFTEHSASLSVYDEVTGTVQNRAYESANGVSIGATIISGTISTQGRAYLVCNNPDKIEIIDAKTLKVAESPLTLGLESPRNAIVYQNRIYVSNWGYEYIVNSFGFWEFNKSYVAVYDLNTKAFIKKVLVGTDAEGMVIANSKLFVAVKEGVAVVDIAGDNMTLFTTIKPAGINGGAKYITFDRNSKLWASFPEKGVVQIDPLTMSVMSSVTVPVDAMDGYITSDVYGEKILTYNTTFNSSYMPEEAGIYSVDVSSKSVSKIFSGIYFYGVGVSPFTGSVFTAEVSFTSNSLMKVFGIDGTQKGSATTGVGTCRYLFY